MASSPMIQLHVGTLCACGVSGYVRSDCASSIRSGMLQVRFWGFALPVLVVSLFQSFVSDVHSRCPDFWSWRHPPPQSRVFQFSVWSMPDGIFVFHFVSTFSFLLNRGRELPSCRDNMSSHKCAHRAETLARCEAATARSRSCDHHDGPQGHMLSLHLFNLCFSFWADMPSTMDVAVEPVPSGCCSARVEVQRYGFKDLSCPLPGFS